MGNQGRHTRQKGEQVERAEHARKRLCHLLFMSMRVRVCLGNGFTNDGRLKEWRVEG